jgi:hypothetical protein
MDSQAFIQHLLGLTTPYGIEGLDPLLVKDPRFDYSTRINPQTGSSQLVGGGDAINTRFDRHLQFLPDLDDRTISDDMWSVTAGGHQGTSEKDQSSPFFMDASKSIVGDAKSVSPDMVRRMRVLTTMMRQPEIRQYHPGLKGFSPQGDHY